MTTTYSCNETIVPLDKGEKYGCTSPTGEVSVMTKLDSVLDKMLEINRNRQEAMELVLICARDIVEAWPNITMRTLGEMTRRMDTLRQALEAAKA